MHQTVPMFRYRWFVENCSQLELPNGKMIVIDPILYKDESDCPHERDYRYISGFDTSVIEKCDYIVLTHVHGDHIGSLKALQARFQAPILVNAWCAYELVKQLDMPVGSVIPMTDGCEYNFDDFRILWQPSRHTAMPGSIPPSVNLLKLPENEVDFSHMGTLYHNNFIIKMRGGMSVAMDGGRFEPHLNELEKHCPTLILRHIERDVTLNTKQVVEQLRRSGSPHLFLLTMQIVPDPEAMVAAANEQLMKEGLYGRVVFAKPGQWVTYTTSAIPE